MKIILAASLVALLVGTAHATLITPNAHYSPFTTAHGANSYTESSGMYAGDTGPSTQEAARIYSKFNLPTFSPTQTVDSATYSIRYSSPYQNPTGALGLYAVNNDAWGEANGWNSMAPLGSLIASFTPTTLNTMWSFDVTSFVSSEYAGDGIASFAIASLTEFSPTIKSWYYFASESGALDVTMRNVENNNVPEPASLGLLSLALLGLGIKRRKVTRSIA